MTDRRLPLLPTLVVLALLMLAGCGGDDGPSEEQYEAGLAKVQQHLKDATEASRESQTEDVDAKREKLGEANEALDAAATVAEELEAPDDAADEHAALAKALREYADVFERLAKLEANDPAETQVYTDAGKVADRLDKASKALEKAGYAVDGDDS